MPSKIVWLAVVLTLVYWLGSAGGCASSGNTQNYKVLEEDKPMFQTQQDPDKPGASLNQPATETNEAQAAAEETEPSVTGLDRSSWSRVQVSPADGTTPHQPHYYDDAKYDATPHGASPLIGSSMASWDRTNTLAAAIDPFKVMLDTALLPLHMLQDPPSKQQLRVPGNWCCKCMKTKPAAAPGSAPESQPAT